MIDKLVSGATGEFFLRWMPNGGTAVLIRALWVTFLLYAAAIGLKSYTASTAAFSFSWPNLRIEVNSTLPWLGAIFAGSYAALYARFSSQWNYLANLYNQIMSICVGLPKAGRNKNTTLTIWRAAFIEDAIVLHLATKPMFATAIHEMLRDPAVKEAFLNSTVNGSALLERLETQLDEIYGKLE